MVIKLNICKDCGAIMTGAAQKRYCKTCRTNQDRVQQRKRRAAQREGLLEAQKARPAQ